MGALFAYELGVGIVHELYEDTVHSIRYTASLDYRYFKLGRGQLARMPLQTSNDRLQSTNLYSQAALVSYKASFY